ncbi:MAG: hypothetical protein HY720_01315 [Planctomycetes bacterium]|nr:hypothetical protein [Planctomycetota bacterium]
MNRLLGPEEFTFWLLDRRAPFHACVRARLSGASVGSSRHRFARRGRRGVPYPESWRRRAEAVELFDRVLSSLRAC